MTRTTYGGRTLFGVFCWGERCDCTCCWSSWYDFVICSKPDVCFLGIVGDHCGCCGTFSQEIISRKSLFSHSKCAQRWVEKSKNGSQVAFLENRIYSVKLIESDKNKWIDEQIWLFSYICLYNSKTLEYRKNNYAVESYFFLQTINIKVLLQSVERWCQHL